MANLPPGAGVRLGPAVRAVVQSTTAAGNVKRARTGVRQYERFHDFCASFNISTADFLAYEDHFPFLSAYAFQYRCGELAPGGSAVKSRTAEDAVRLISQTFQMLGLGDPRTDPATRRMDSRWTRLWKDWKHYDDPPKRVKPIPLGILLEAQRLADESGSIALQATARMMWVAFFFLCRPGEYCATVDGNHFFRLCDVALKFGSHVLDLERAPDAELRAAAYAELEFTDQKNHNRGEKVGQYDSGHASASATKAIAEQVIHLRNNGASNDAPLCSYMHNDQWYLVTPPMLTNLLRQAASRVGHKYGIAPADISARSMRASGAMALLCANVAPTTIKLLGRWQSDTMLQYLHIQSPTLVKGLAGRMVKAGDFSFLPGTRQYRLVENEQPEGLYRD